MLPPPIDIRYESPKLAIATINRFARDQGYSVSTLRSVHKNGVKKRVYLCCTRGRVWETSLNDNDRIRNKTTLAVDCLFQVTLRHRVEDNAWHLTYEDTLHNHSPTHPRALHIHRTQELIERALDIDHLIRQGFNTRQILTRIREEDPSSALIARDIYNRRYKVNAEFLDGRTLVQALLIELPKDGEWIFKHELDDEGHITALFCMHRTSIRMLQLHPWVISMDCTYKTNRYGLPLLDIVGFASTGQTFHLAFGFIQDEKQDSYEVILRCLAEAYESLEIQHPRTILIDKERALINAINIVFPDTKTISCIWYIDMNLLKKARPLLSDQIAIARRDNQLLLDRLGFTLPDSPLAT